MAAPLRPDVSAEQITMLRAELKSVDAAWAEAYERKVKQERDAMEEAMQEAMEDPNCAYRMTEPLKQVLRDWKFSRKYNPI